MSSEDIILVANKRDVLGKKVKQLRNAGETPAVVHEKGKDSQHVSISAPEFKKAFAAAGRHHAIRLEIDGKKYTTIIKEVTNAPARADIVHAVFQAIKDDEKVSAELPIRLSEDIPAERASLLVLKKIEHIEVEALPKDLIDSIEIDASSLAEVGDKLHVGDIKLPATVTLKTDPETVIATVETPKDQIAEADAALEEQKAADAVTAPEGEEVPAETGETKPEAEAEQNSEKSSTDKKEG